MPPLAPWPLSDGVVCVPWAGVFQVFLGRLRPGARARETARRAAGRAARRPAKNEPVEPARLLLRRPTIHHTQSTACVPSTLLSLSRTSSHRPLSSLNHGRPLAVWPTLDDGGFGGEMRAWQAPSASPSPSPRLALARPGPPLHPSRLAADSAGCLAPPLAIPPLSRPSSSSPNHRRSKGQRADAGTLFSPPSRPPALSRSSRPQPFPTHHPTFLPFAVSLPSSHRLLLAHWRHGRGQQSLRRRARARAGPRGRPSARRRRYPAPGPRSDARAPDQHCLAFQQSAPVLARRPDWCRERLARQALLVHLVRATVFFFSLPRPANRRASHLLLPPCRLHVALRTHRS